MFNLIKLLTDQSTYRSIRSSQPFLKYKTFIALIFLRNNFFYQPLPMLIFFISLTILQNLEIITMRDEFLDFLIFFWFFFSLWDQCLWNIIFLMKSGFICISNHFEYVCWIWMFLNKTTIKIWNTDPSYKIIGVDLIKIFKEFA